jgi:ribonuclease P protein component
MLAKPLRLRRAGDITRAYKKGAYGSSSGILSVKAVSSGRSTARVVVVVGKKVNKRAVVRNRIRRRLVGDLETHWQTLRPGYDIVISVHSDVSAMTPAKLHEHLHSALARAGASLN